MHRPYDRLPTLLADHYNARNAEERYHAAEAIAKLASAALQDAEAEFADPDADRDEDYWSDK